ncbi:TPA: bis(5'-nucleosyl)-tetraphosphatase (symmetrical) YqeK [Candidatus Scatousia excrementigallinarum]|uniref:bis(5'-nucleosyl)-tetraphosphatase (symmetrical) n=1 Tax=Candidatus Scatousia excrementigallinarum TaxID=2840935 RepID=A0A9D1EY98_9BACT|nr:bis(5'-nucleosyl)-tetraphosphatase (symmetrical) YqeK [Candidatus Scatousia excrementigallinarum]
MNYTKVNEEEIKQWLKDNLNEERYIHSLGTAECARELADKFDLDKDKAYTAGLLHDCAKCFSNEKLLKIIQTNLNVEEAEMLNYKTLHAPVSAYYAKEKFGVYDKEILSAIRWHTLGQIDMSDFEKIIFLADKIEPNTRDKEYAAVIRSYLEEENGLNKALLKCYKETIKSLVKRDLKICLLTIEIYNKLEDLVNV